ncbi:PaaI family thioesterase [Sorangium sp. So ce327]|uniref:PaaI family thioesterase n=1 Tax=Sorangium sp. So ce327 TaxID=3133301 RepID=UPI003F61E133
MPNADHYRRLERMFASAPVSQWQGASAEVSERRAVVTIPVKQEFFHAAQAVHGSLYFRALDDAAFFAVNSAVEDVFVLTVSFTIYFTRPITGGALRAEGRLTHSSSRLYIAESTLVNDEGKLLGQGSGTFMKSTIPLRDALGYV